MTQWNGKIDKYTVAVRDTTTRVVTDVELTALVRVILHRPSKSKRAMTSAGKALTQR